MGMYCGKLAYQFFLIDFMHEQKIFFFNMFKKPKNLDWFCKVFNFFFLNQKQEKTAWSQEISRQNSQF